MVDNQVIFTKFTKWYDFAGRRYEKFHLDNFNACCLSTYDGIDISSRIVLVKSFSPEGFFFYTNLNSRKAKAIQTNNKISLLFYWPIISRQISIQGTAQLVNNDLADEYFNTRPYLSKIGAWASKQSSPMATGELSKRVVEYSLKYPHDVPRPEHWSGFLVVPNRMEFWKEQFARLHVRKVYTRVSADDWEEQLLFP